MPGDGAGDDEGAAKNGKKKSKAGKKEKEQPIIPGLKPVSFFSLVSCSLCSRETYFRLVENNEIFFPTGIYEKTFSHRKKS
jgi:hypothetical protein